MHMSVVDRFRCLWLLLSLLIYSEARSVNVLRRPFVTVWNAPSAVCEDKFNIKLNLTMFDIVSNKNQSFYGNDMVIFYKKSLGLYPYVLENGTFINGGLPQLASFEEHFRKSRYDISKTIGDTRFDGLSVIDWESWRPIFRRNWYDKDKHVYVNQSVIRVQERHPTWNSTRTLQFAEHEFEAAAKILMERTLLQGRQLRPFGYWGFYGFPGCYNYRRGQRFCANDTVFYNDRLSWMFSASSALYPSIYLYDDSTSVIDRKYRVEGTLRESLRVRDQYSEPYTPIYAYSMYRYGTSGTYYILDDLINTIGQSFDAGLDGIVIWESSHFFRTRSDCLSFQNYLDKSLGPFIKQITMFATKCSEILCNGHGKCINKTWHNEYEPDPNIFQRNISDYNCKCYKHWKGDHCDIKYR